MTLSIAASSSGRAGRMTRPSGKRDVRGVFLFHADGVVSRVDMMRFARNARREVAEEIERRAAHIVDRDVAAQRSEEHTSELQSLMRISYAVFCLKKKKKHNPHAI